MKLYLSGPMTGIEDYNFPAFNNWARQLRNVGYEVINPAENDNGSQDKPYEFYLRKDIESLLKCDAVATLYGWKNSKGAMLEVNIAETLKLTVRSVATWYSIGPSENQKAKEEVKFKEPVEYLSLVDEGRKYDNNKPRMDLISPSAMEALGTVLAYGADKYDARNWEKGIDFGRVYAAVQRHLNAWWSGDATDDESKLPHLHHALTGVMFLVHYTDFYKDYEGHDDRP